MHLYAKLDQNIPCCSSDVSIVTNTANKNTLRKGCVNVLFTLQERLILSFRNSISQSKFCVPKRFDKTLVVMDLTLAPTIFKPEKNLVFFLFFFFRINSWVPEMTTLVSLSD